MLEVEEEDYFNADDDDDFIPPIATPLFPRAQAPSPPLNLLKRKRRAGLNISTGFRPTLTPPRPPPIGSLVDYDDEDQDQGGQASMDDDISAAPTVDLSLLKRSPSPNILTSPRLPNRQISSSTPSRRSAPDDDEDNLLEALVRPKDQGPHAPSITTPKVPDLGLGPLRLSGKRRREDDDDELLERLANKTKRPDLGAEKVLGTGGRAGSKPGDDPPKKIKLKFGLTSLGAAPTKPSGLPSEAGVKDGDTG
jgi:protein phosphatase-4 regulatory subunit 3